MAQASSTKTGSIREVLGDRPVVVAAGVNLVIMLGYGLIVPSLPLFARSFGVGAAEVGVLITSFALMRLVFDLVGGPLVDRFGERRTATAGAVIVGISSALSAVAPSFGLLVVFRAAGGAGSSILYAAVMNFLIHSVPPERMARTMSFFFASFLLGTALGQPLGGLIAEHLGLASPLAFYSGACFAAAALTFRYITDHPGARGAEAPGIPEPAETEASLPTAWGRVRGLLSGRAFVTALAANAVMFLLLGSVRMTLVPLFARERVGLSETGVGAALGVAAVAQFAVMWKAGALADSRGRKAALVPALAGLGVSAAVLGWSTSVAPLVAALALMGVSTAFAGVVPAAIVADVAPRRSSGTAVGVFRFAGDVGFVLGPLVAGVVADTVGFRAAFLAVAAPVIPILVLAAGMPETLRRVSPGG